MMDLVARGRQLTETVEWVDSERIKRSDLHKHLEKPSGAGVERGQGDCERNANVRKGNVGVVGNCLSVELLCLTHNPWLQGVFAQMCVAPFVAWRPRSEPWRVTSEVARANHDGYVALPLAATAGSVARKAHGCERCEDV